MGWPAKTKTIDRASNEMLDTTEDRRCNNQQLKETYIDLLRWPDVWWKKCCCCVDMPADLAPPRPLLLVVEGAEFDHLWMLPHHAGHLWSCWHFLVCCDFDGAMHFVGFVCLLDRTNGTNRSGPPQPHFLMEGAEFNAVSPRARRAGHLRSC